VPFSVADAPTDIAGYDDTQRQLDELLDEPLIDGEAGAGGVLSFIFCLFMRISVICREFQRLPSLLDETRFWTLVFTSRRLPLLSLFSSPRTNLTRTSFYCCHHIDTMLLYSTGIADGADDATVPLTPNPVLYESMPPYDAAQGDTIRRMLLHVWNIKEPKEWQVRAIHAMVSGTNLVRNQRRIGINRRTSDGKSLPILGGATIRRGVTLVFVNLISVGCDQTASAQYMQNDSANVYADHLDTIRDPHDVAIMGNFLLGLRKADVENRSIILWMSPETVNNHDLWNRCVASLLKHGCITQLIIDEAHALVQDGRFFRPAFYTAIRRYVHMLWGKVTMLFLSATFNLPLRYHMSLMLHKDGNDRDKLPSLLGVDDPNVPISNEPNFGLPTPFFTSFIYGWIARPKIRIRVTISSQYKSHLGDVVKTVRAKKKALVYCATAKMATDTVKPAASAALAEQGDGDALTLIGGDGIMMKQYLIDMFSGRLDSELVKLVLLIGTSAVQCGVSANDLHFILALGWPRRMVELLQLLGRLMRTLLARTPPDAIHYVVSLQGFLMHYAIISNLDDKDERARQHREYRTVVEFFLFPGGCYHTVMHMYYSHKDLPPMDACKTNCPWCLEEHLAFTGQVRVVALVDHLDSAVFVDGPVTPMAMCKSLGGVVSKIWTGKVKDAKAGNIQALVLQMWLGGIIYFTVPREFKFVKSILPEDTQ